jgi:hypothetical protein
MRTGSRKDNLSRRRGMDNEMRFGFRYSCRVGQWYEI